ncbi:phospholipid scramblase family member 5-like [Rhinatrema bivittatum]|uniref:phospholipid scramblase family member 5-like n=1 Tax=Rhinatrema bivittatum TaxID=194408 RepID=UPI00112E7116|nr:phospholipid scramblase family member 5-like [Rhinatrema bivittatum]
MSVVCSQPSPFGHLRREKHIETCFKTRKEKGKSPQPPEALEGGSRPHAEATFSAHSKQPAELKGSQRIIKLIQPEVPKHLSVREEGAYSSKQWTPFNMKCGGMRVQESLPTLPSALGCGGQKGKKCDSTKHLTLLHELEDDVSLGLQLLAGVDQLCITSNALQQAYTCDPGRSYTISTRKGKQLFVAVEESSCLCLQLCGPARSCCIQLLDQGGQEVLQLFRPYRMDVCWMGCCLMEMRVYTAGQQSVGTVRQRWSVLSPLLEACDSEGRWVMKISGSCSATRCYSDQEFQVTSRAGQLLAVIWKRWPGFNTDYNMDHEYFGLDISATLNPSDRALLLAAAFLLVILEVLDG